MALACSVEVAAKPRVTVSVDIQLPYTERWSDAGQLEPLKSRIAATAIGYLAQFRFLDWVVSESGTPHLQIIAEEAAAAGAKPWNLRITRTDHRSRPELSLLLADAARVQRIDRPNSAKQVEDWAAAALEALANDAGAQQFLDTVLQEINVAEKVRAVESIVFVRVAYGELCADTRTQVRAQVPTSQAHFPMSLRYEGAPKDPSMTDRYTAWQVVPPTAANYTQYVGNAERPASVSVAAYYPYWAPLSRNTIQTRKSCAP